MMTAKTQTRKYDTSLRVETDDYAWAECGECGNTIKFGGGSYPFTVCPACASRYTADRLAKTTTCTLSSSDISDEDYFGEDYWGEDE